MSNRNYLKFVKSTLSPVNPEWHATLGLIGEIGELCDAIKKHEIYNQELDIVNVKEELGDILYYVALHYINEDLLDEWDESLTSVIELSKEYFEGTVSKQVAIEFSIRALTAMATATTGQNKFKTQPIFILGLLAHHLIGATIVQIMDGNFDKLEVRYPDGYSNEDANARLDKK